MQNKFPVFLFFLYLPFLAFSQKSLPALDKAMQQFLQDPTLQHALTGLYVTNSKTNEVVYALNEQVGMAPGSTQKIFTGIAAFDLLGKDFRFETSLGYSGEIKSGQLNGDLIVQGDFDPSLGSERYPNTNPSHVFSRMGAAIRNTGIEKIQGKIQVLPPSATIPSAWIWEDLGNYFGAAASGLNWRENKYDLHLRSGDKTGDPVEILSVNNDTGYPISFTNELTTAAKGTGDQSYIFLPLNNTNFLIRGTIPAGEKNFIVRGAMPDPVAYFLYDFKKYLQNKFSLAPANMNVAETKKEIHPLYTHYSPTLDSLEYFFLQESINLYGEAFLKKMAELKIAKDQTEDGVKVLTTYWKTKGIDNGALHIFDGSGLSPQNRVTPFALVQALNYAKGQSWFPAFFKAIPVHNQIKMKSGTINSVKAYAGYIHAKDGTDYTFAFIVNNYTGSHAILVQKMYAVLNSLK